MPAHMTKVPEFPRPHDFSLGFGIGVDSTAVRKATILPIITHDEGLGAMSAYESNVANPSFAEANTPHCFPTSRINNVFAQLTVSMSKVMLETDKVAAVQFHTATIHTAFNEGADALDDISTLDLNEILELQSETTDRQTYPLYNTVDLADYKSNARLDMHAEQLGLDTDLEVEAVAFILDDWHDCLTYYTNGPKLRQIATPMQTHILTKNNPYKKIRFYQQTNTKYMNPYAFLAALIYVPPNAGNGQFGKAGDTTIDTCNLEFEWRVRYNEFNHEFNHSLL